MQLTDKEKSLAGKIALFLFTLLAFLGIKSVSEVLDEIKAQINTINPDIKPALKDVGDTLLDALATGGTLIEDPNTQTIFEKWVGIVKGAWDAIEGGASTVVTFFEALIAGHKAKVASKASQG